MCSIFCKQHLPSPLNGASVDTSGRGSRPYVHVPYPPFFCPNQHHSEAMLRPIHAEHLTTGVYTQSMGHIVVNGSVHTGCKMGPWGDSQELVHTGCRAPRNRRIYAKYGTYCGQWECSHRLQNGALGRLSGTSSHRMQSTSQQAYIRKVWDILWSMRVFTQLASNIKGLACKFACKCAYAFCVNGPSGTRDVHSSTESVPRAPATSLALFWWRWRPSGMQPPESSSGVVSRRAVSQ